jgi:peptidoglycan L-alanyl-D-glutamate endopeptidase CwlK
MILDARSERNILTLHPKVQKMARVFMNAAIPIAKAKGYDVRIISGTRTFAEQDAIYAQGRTAKGKIVTNARGGYSNHNFGIAFDVGVFKDTLYFGTHPLYDELGLVGESLGFEWGGRWKKMVDKPHFQAKTGLTIAQMRERVNAKQDILA